MKTNAAGAPLSPLRRVLANGERLVLVVLLLAVAAFFSLHPSTSDTFPTQANVRNLLSSQVVVCLLALAIIVPLVARSFDLSVGANLGLCSIATAAAMSRFDLPLAVAVVVAVTFGALVGLVNAVAIAYLKLDSFIITLASATVIGGVVTWYTGGLAISSGISSSLREFGTREAIGLPATTFLLIAIAAVVWYLLEHTPFGRYLHAIGSNPKAAQLVGVRVERVKFWSHVAAGVLAGIAGVVAVANLGGATPTTGPDLLFPAFAAAFLGATSIRPGTFNVVGTVVGVFFLAVCVNGLTHMGVRSWVAPVFNGAALFAAVLASTQLSRLRRAEV